MLPDLSNAVGGSDQIYSTFELQWVVSVKSQRLKPK